MQGIEPKLHSTLIERIKYYRGLLNEAKADSDDQFNDIAITNISELSKLYEDYLQDKKKLERSIKKYRDYHAELRKLLTLKLRELRRKRKK
ncbi:hypothetical protein [Chryseobacterium oryctis]|uniref:Uncharacterized protein n=1 Tax=Chryseobacterium oryctis TaxID=2952618 RepID=A0ABT3HSI2_9FLAO|nr:hypothetical protein [Chryseobacterium oryctis]MCW3162735.1 hypothetical protein [Chryseobacterium oryctis]